MAGLASVVMLKEGADRELTSLSIPEPARGGYMCLGSNRYSLLPELGS